MRGRRSIAFASVLLAGALCVAAPEARVIAALQGATYFSVWAVGVVPKTSGNEKTFRQFVQQTRSADDALKLIAEGTPAGKIYGFLALRKIAPRQFSEVAPRHFADQTAVPIENGCIRGNDTLGSLVRQISEGKIALLPESK